MTARKFLSGEAFKSMEEAQAGLREPGCTLSLDEGQRQMVLLALAKLAIERPGWQSALEEIALQIDNAVDVIPGNDPIPEMFTRFREMHEPAKSTEARAVQP